MPRTVSGRRLTIQKFNASLYLNGTSTYVDTSVLPNLNGFNFSIWYKPGTYNVNEQNIITYSNLAGTNGFRLMVEGSGTAKLYVILKTDIGDRFIDLFPIRGARKFEWVHIAVTSVPGSHKGYVNGVLVDTTNGIITAAPTASLRLGATYVPAQYGRANISNFILENTTTPWTADQVLTLCKDGTIPNRPTVNYSFGEGSGSVAYDTSGNGNNGTITSPNWSTEIPTALRTAVTTPRRTIKDNRYSVRWPTLGSGRGLATASNKVAELGVTNLNYSAGIWVKESSRRVTFGNIIFILKTNSPYIYAFQIRSNGSGTFGLAFYDGTLNPILNSPSSYSVGEWYHVALTRQGTSVKLYINGLLVNTGSITVGSTLSDAIEISSTSAAFAGNVSKAFIYGRVLTAAEISNIYSDDVYPDDALFNAPLNEGKGTIAYDKVSNNNFTLTTPTWSTNTVTGIRRQDKLLQNGDFEFAPAFTAPTTGSSRWIDGTANGSTNISQYGWGMIKTGTASAQFDTTVKQSGTTSLKLSTASVSSYIEADVYNTLATGEPKSYLIPALQSTSYTLSFYMKTEYISGDSSQGATVGLAEHNGVLTVVRDNTGTGAVLKTTTGWTYYSFSVTTLSTTRFINVQPRIFGHTGAATLQMNAWFDDITLVKN